LDRRQAADRAVRANLRERVRNALARLPIGPEQWERTHEPIIANNLERLVLLAQAAATGPPGAALDVGVGYGYSAAAVRAARPGEELWCLEHPSRDVRFTPAWRNMLAVCDCRAILADAGALPFRSGVFSVVCAAELIEHLSPERLPSVLVEMVRVLRPGGVLVVTTPNLARLRNRLALLRGRPFLTSPAFRIGSTYGHLREYAGGEVAELLVYAGLTQIVVSFAPSRGIAAHGALPSRVLALAEWFLPKVGCHELSTFLVAWGRKP